jgi:hypothetical protein
MTPNLCGKESEIDFTLSKIAKFPVSLRLVSILLRLLSLWFSNFTSSSFFELLLENVIFSFHYFNFTLLDFDFTVFF